MSTSMLHACYTTWNAPLSGTIMLSLVQHKQATQRPLSCGARHATQTPAWSAPNWQQVKKAKR